MTTTACPRVSLMRGERIAFVTRRPPLGLRAAMGGWGSDDLESDISESGDEENDDDVDDGKEDGRSNRTIDDLSCEVSSAEGNKGEDQGWGTDSIESHEGLNQQREVGARSNAGHGNVQL